MLLKGLAAQKGLLADGAIAGRSRYLGMKALVLAQSLLLGEAAPACAALVRAHPAMRHKVCFQLVCPAELLLAAQV